ncbi:hypothetical protein BDR06DRAFT_970405 [Suillus hirtellus]|nr:hypothetical protein BDR06DRAFT_970405 [Suillus hirtellus]
MQSPMNPRPAIATNSLNLSVLCRCLRNPLEAQTMMNSRTHLTSLSKDVCATQVLKRRLSQMLRSDDFSDRLGAYAFSQQVLLCDHHHANAPDRYRFQNTASIRPSSRSKHLDVEYLDIDSLPDCVSLKPRRKKWMVFGMKRRRIMMDPRFKTTSTKDAQCQGHFGCQPSSDYKVANMIKTEQRVFRPSYG